MKLKYFTIIMGLTVLLTFTGCSINEINTNNITQIDVSPSPFLQHLSNFQEFDNTNNQAVLFTDLINLALKSKAVVEHNPNNDLGVSIFISKDKKRNFTIDLDPEEKDCYINEGDLSYYLTAEECTTFYSSNLYSNYLSLDFYKPTLKITNNQKEIPYIYNGSLKYQLYNHEFKKMSYSNDLSSNTLPASTMNTPPSELAPYEFDTSNMDTHLHFANQPTDIIEEIYTNDTLIDRFQIIDNKLITPLKDGNYIIKLICTWENSSDNFIHGRLTYSIPIHFDLPSQFNLSTNEAYPGEILFIKGSNINPDQDVHIQTDLYNHDVHFFQSGDTQVGILPLNGALSPSNNTLHITTMELNNQKSATTYNLQILEKEFETNHLIISPEQVAKRTQPEIQEETEKLASIRSLSLSSPTMLWTEPFITPAEGEITTGFYEIRYTNNNPVPRRHEGIDIANAYFSDVVSTNTGKVVFAEKLTLYGNTIIIDHGWGLYSSYSHLQRISVEVGDLVEKRSVIGLMGSTGFSTGSHLHFEFYYDGSHIDPNFLINKDPFREALK